MKIYYVTDARIPTEKAHGYQIIKMCEALGILKNNVTLIVPHRINSPELKNVDPYNYYDCLKTFIIKKLFVPDFIWFTRRLPAKLQYAIFLIHAILFSIAAIFYCIRGKPTFILTRDSRIAWFLSIFWRVIYEAHLFPGNKLDCFFERNAYMRCGAFVVITERLKEMYKRNGYSPEKIYVLPDGVDISKFNIMITKQDARLKLGMDEQKKIVGYIGRFRIMDVEKGLIELIRSMKFINRNDVQLIIIGGPAEFIEIYKKMIINENLPAERYIFRNAVPHSEVPLYLRSFDCCVLTLPWRESFATFMSPLKMFEYMASGCPIIAPDLPNVREILDEDTAVLVAPGESKDYAAAIEKILSDREFAHRISQNAMHESAKYTWIKRAEKIIEMSMIK